MSSQVRFFDRCGYIHIEIDCGDSLDQDYYVPKKCFVVTKQSDIDLMIPIDSHTTKYINYNDVSTSAPPGHENIDELIEILLEYVCEDDNREDPIKRQRVSIAKSVFDAKFRYNKQGTKFSKKIKNGGDVKHIKDHNAINIRSSNELNSMTVYQTRSYIPHQFPGPMTVFIAAKLRKTRVSPGNIVRIGYFDDANCKGNINDYGGGGIFIELDGSGTLWFVYRHFDGFVQTDVRIEQSNWNIDPLDGNGNSQIEIDPTQINIYIFEIMSDAGGWLRFGIVYKGCTLWVHEVLSSNKICIPSIFGLSLPIRFENNNVNTPDYLVRLATGDRLAGLDNDGYIFGHVSCADDINKIEVICGDKPHELGFELHPIGCPVIIPDALKNCVDLDLTTLLSETSLHIKIFDGSDVFFDSIAGVGVTAGPIAVMTNISVLSSTASESDFGSEIDIQIAAAAATDFTSPLQTFSFHTSCSKDIYLGEHYASLKLFKFVNDDNGTQEIVSMPPCEDSYGIMNQEGCLDFEQLTCTSVHYVVHCRLAGIHINDGYFATPGSPTRLTSKFNQQLLSKKFPLIYNGDVLLVLGETDERFTCGTADNRIYNGVWTVVDKGSSTTPWILERETGFDVDDSLLCGVCFCDLNPPGEAESSGSSKKSSSLKTPKSKSSHSKGNINCRTVSVASTSTKSTGHTSKDFSSHSSGSKASSHKTKSTGGSTKTKKSSKGSKHKKHNYSSQIVYWIVLNTGSFIIDQDVLQVVASPTLSGVKYATGKRLAGVGVNDGYTMTASVPMRLTSNVNVRLRVNGKDMDNGYRILVKNEEDERLTGGTINRKIYNGVYTVIERGSGSIPWVIERDNDFDTADDIQVGIQTQTIESGTDSAGEPDGGYSKLTTFALKRKKVSLNLDCRRARLNDKILVKDEVDETLTGGTEDKRKYNGVYQVVRSGYHLMPWTLSRCIDFNETSEVIQGAKIDVSGDGCNNDDTCWEIVTADPIIVDTTPIEFAECTREPIDTLIYNVAAHVENYCPLKRKSCCHTSNVMTMTSLNSPMTVLSIRLGFETPRSIAWPRRINITEQNGNIYKWSLIMNAKLDRNFPLTFNSNYNCDSTVECANHDEEQLCHVSKNCVVACGISCNGCVNYTFEHDYVVLGSSIDGCKQDVLTLVVERVFATCNIVASIEWEEYE